MVLGGKEYGSGSSRDWAVKGTALLGVKAVIAESFERIHRSNLIGMGVVPLQFPDGASAASLGLDGTETFSVTGLTAFNEGVTPRTVKVEAAKADGSVVSFDATVRIDTPGEADYFRNGGILQYVRSGTEAGDLKSARPEGEREQDSADEDRAQPGCRRQVQVRQEVDFAFRTVEVGTGLVVAHELHFAVVFDGFGAASIV